MSNMINLGNLGAAPQASPAVQGIAGQTAPSQGDSSSLFSALLMQHIGPNLSNTDNPEALINPEQSFSSEAEFTRLLPSLLAQTKDSKSLLPANHQTDDSTKVSNDNPALAIWIASMAAMQMQPNFAVPPPQINGLSPLPTSIGTGQNSTLQALEQQFPGLVSAFAGNHFADGKQQNSKADATRAISPDPKQMDVDPAEAIPTAVKAAEPNPTPLDAKPEFEAELSASQIADSKKSDIQSTNAAVTTIAPKISTVPDKGKVDPKNQISALAEKANQLQSPHPTPIQSVGAKSQSQSYSQTDDNHSSNQQKKDSASAAIQGQQSANQVNGSANATAIASPSIATDQSNFAALTQVVAHSAPANVANPANSVAPQAVNVRDIGSVAAIDPAPRIVPAARLMEAAGQAEMKVSVKSDAGTVDVRAILEGGNISATVAAQHSGTRDWMMSNMHELQSSLSRNDLNLKIFEVTDSGLQNSDSGGQPKQQEQQQRSNNPTYSSFAPETHSSSQSLDDIGPQETASQALSLLA